MLYKETPPEKYFKDMAYYCSSGHAIAEVMNDAFDKTPGVVYYSKLSIMEDNQNDRNHGEQKECRSPRRIAASRMEKIGCLHAGEDAVIIGAAADRARESTILRVFHHEEEDRTEREKDGRILRSRTGTEWKSKTKKETKRHVRPCE